ncbi:MAG: histidine ammonia-lyase [Alphaproteobacteria bacterium]|nr:histidine ammonia-lyase [Alphaproteobacteria bacterium]
MPDAPRPLTPALTLADWRAVAAGAPVALDPSCKPSVDAARATIAAIVEEDRTVYGVNTGFGRLARTSIPRDKLLDLQNNLVKSHAVGTGAPLDDETVRLVLALKAASLARGCSGVAWETIGALVRLIETETYPVIPAKGSVGASGDLAPLAHLACALIGVGRVRRGGREMDAAEGLRAAELAPLALGPKEGLALLNGTQVSTALALKGLFAAEDAFAAAAVAGALSVDAAKGSDSPFDPRIQAIRGHAGQADMATLYRALLAGSRIRESHLTCDRVQDPYSLRCQPQVMGACLDHIRFAARTFATEAAAVSDNPLVFAETGEVLSGGNFHAEPVALSADVLAIALSEVGALSERRIALLMDPGLSGLPAFLVEDGGVNSGFMIAQVTAAALASENKTLAHPASVDSLPTSANQEDHVSMATFAARRLTDIAENVAGVAAVELLAAAQAIDFHRPLETSPALQRAMTLIRARVPGYERDRFWAPDLAAITDLVQSGVFRDFLPEALLPSG